LPEKIWNHVVPYQGHNWSLPKRQTPLADIVGQTAAQNVYNITDSATRNIQLRSILSAPLKSKDMALRLAAMRWVIYNWGGVRGKRGSEEIWPEELGRYKASEIEKFITTRKNKRIASWSKVLAFADSQKYAIYDARVVVTLNSILDEIGNDNHFFMPPPSAQDLPILFQKMKAQAKQRYAKKRVRYLGYFEYMDLLNSFVEKKLVANVLDAEMHLFANFEIYANKFAANNGLTKPYP
jgi:predicted nucleic acid-binding Zn ribbon protein